MMQQMEDLFETQFESQIETYHTLAHEWLCSFRELAKKLRDITSSTEGDFLEVGSSLQNYYFKAEEISKKASSIAGLMSGGEIEHAIDGLGNILDELNHHMSHLQKKSSMYSSNMENLLELLHNAIKLIEQFRKIVNFLSMLGISTRIESSHLGKSDAGFKTLAVDIKKLAKLIDSKSSNIEEQSETMSGLIKQTKAKLLEMRNRQNQQAMIILSSARKSLEILNNLHENSSQVAKSISDQSENISRNIGEVVTSSQFHDITRQQIEHVSEALEELSDELNPHQGNHSNEDEQYWRELIGVTGNILDIQRSQLYHSDNEFSTAVNNIINNLQGISASVSNMSAETTRLSGATSEEGSSILRKIEEGVTSIISLLNENINTSQELSSAVSMVAGKVSELTGFVSDIDDISSEIELIALNARVKAAHTGSKGAALGVLAESLQKLSIEAHSRTLVVSSELSKIVDTSSSLNQDIIEELNNRDSGVKTMVDGLEGLLKSLRDVNSHIFQLLKEVDKSGKALSADIRKFTTKINVHNEVSSVINPVLKQLDNIISESREMVPAYEAKDFKRLKALSNRYTMDSERHIHKSVDVPYKVDKDYTKTNFNSKYSDNDNIDLFDTVTDDDNIELFDNSANDIQLWDDGVELFGGEEESSYKEEVDMQPNDNIELFDEDFGDNVDLF